MGGSSGPEPDRPPLLRVEDVTVAYGPVQALRGVSLEVHDGEVVTVLGPNGAGKSTLMRTIAGVLSPVRGHIVFRDRPIAGARPEEIVRLGISLVPEGRQVFPALTVRENLEMGAVSRRDRAAVGADLESILERFPVLRERRSQLAGSLSGGEQQQLAIGRALMSRPRLILLDEPSLGLAPIVVDHVFQLIAELRRQGVTILLVEQNVHRALEVADRGYVLTVGEVVISGTGDELRSTETALERAYLGIAAR